MHWSELESKWNTLKSKVREQWGRLTDDEVSGVAGKRDRLVDKIQQVYGKTRQEAEIEADSFCQRCE